MGREVRRVPKDWQHPIDENGNCRPLHGRSYAKTVAAWDEGAAQWARGYRSDFNGGWVPKDADHAYSFEEWDGKRPVPEDYMPDWPESERTHLQMYETCTEGTPISPVMETAEELARWLADTGASAFGGMTASYEGWLATAQSEHGSVGIVIIPGVAMTSGVEMMKREIK